jgi:hypothetical protein
MSDFSDFIANGLSDLISLVGETVTFRGDEFSADVGILSMNPMFDTGGEIQRKSCTIVLERSVASDPPRKTEKITTPHGTLEIVGISIDPAAYTLTCAEIGGKK